MSLLRDHKTVRILLIVLSQFAYVAALIINALAGPGKGPFQRSTGNISDIPPFHQQEPGASSEPVLLPPSNVLVLLTNRFYWFGAGALGVERQRTGLKLGSGSEPALELPWWKRGNRYQTEITPAGWTFSIWGVIYSWLFLMNAYILTWLCRGLYSNPAILPSEFFLSWIINMILNSTWLVLWDRELMIPALIVLALIAFTNYLMIFFSCLGLRAHGSWLKQQHPKDLFCIIVLVQNGIATYATWTTIATLLNFTIVLDLASVSPTHAATASLCILLLEVIIWFTVENFLIEKHVRYILTVYPVIIYALIGSLSKHYIAAGPGRNAIFSMVLLVLGCILLVVRVGLVVWRHRTRPLFREISPEVLMSPNSGTDK